MEDKTSGAWIAHHADKLDGVRGVTQFEKIRVTGKMCRLLSAISQDEDASLDRTRLEAHARAVGVSPELELDGVLVKLESQHLVQVGAHGVDVLGVTQSSVLAHTGAAFRGMQPSAEELAVLDLAEHASASPIEHDDVAERIGDAHQLSDGDVGDVLSAAREIGFVDSEAIDAQRRIYFNGNLFKRQNVKKVQAVLDSLAPSEAASVRQLDAELQACGCVSIDRARAVLGEDVFGKLHSIGMYDVNSVQNEREEAFFVTAPSAFGKFGDPLGDDALDLAKLFVTCLTYGMTRRRSSQGRIAAVDRLLRKLIDGARVGPVTAIGEDYTALERRGVVECDHAYGGRYFMKLLKKDIGELALAVLRHGDASDVVLTQMPAAPATSYTAPERNRVARRKELTTVSKKTEREALLAIRGGGF